MSWGEDIRFLKTLFHVKGVVSEQSMSLVCRGVVGSDFGEALGSTLDSLFPRVGDLLSHAKGEVVVDLQRGLSF